MSRCVEVGISQSPAMASRNEMHTLVCFVAGLPVLNQFPSPLQIYVANASTFTAIERTCSREGTWDAWVDTPKNLRFFLTSLPAARFSPSCALGRSFIREGYLQICIAVAILVRFSFTLSHILSSLPSRTILALTHISS
jgi:hypothetical protein